jgi:predicted dehydrogenase
MKIATIGSGPIVSSFIKAMPIANVKLEAVYSRNAATAQAFAKENGAAKFYTDIDEMLADKEIDTVYIASPNSLHFQYALKVLKSHKNAIVEKPFTVKSAQALELFQTAKENNVFVFEAISTLFLPNYKIIKENISRLGAIKIVTLNFSQFSSRYLKYVSGGQVNVFDPKFAGGALGDINVYNIHFLVGLFGIPKEYKYYANIGYNGIDTSGVMILVYDGFIATAIAAKDCESPYMFFIQGDKGTLKVDQSSVGVCKNIALFLRDNEKNIDGIGRFGGFTMEEQFMPIGIDQTHHLSYELAEFKRIIDEKDLKSYEKLKKQTIGVLEIMQKARKDAGIKFEEN